MSGVNAFEESDRAARARLEEEFARQIARGLELAGEVERLEAEVERLTTLRTAQDQCSHRTVTEWRELEAEVERLQKKLEWLDPLGKMAVLVEANERLRAENSALMKAYEDLARAALTKEKAQETVQHANLAFLADLEDGTDDSALAEEEV